VLQHYNASFRYTLQPPLLGQESVDEFLWETQAGFCEHFASSFVFFMRAAGIPARVVVGYQGGEYNPLENYYAVRQREAHAWAEVWLPERGWVRVDPTAAVAPERIEQGVDFSLDEEDVQLLGNSFVSDISLLNTLRLRWEGFNYLWSRWVLGYNAETQGSLFERWLGGVDIWRIALFVLASGALILGVIVLFLLWGQRRRYRYPADRYYQLYCNKLARLGFSRQSGEAPRDFAQRVIHLRPDLSKPINSITELYEWASYAGNQAALIDLRRAVANFVVRST
jgi:protein-glutamine gamma-glutamyltransferase